MRNATLKPSLALAVSGAASGLLVYYIAAFTCDWAPGILFGLTTGILFMTAKTLSLWRTLIWVAASAIIWFAVFYIYVQINGDQLEQTISLLPLLTSGAIGSLLLALIRSRLASFKLAQIVKTIAAGVLLALAMQFILAPFNPDLNPAAMAAAFAVWQIGVGLMLLA